MIKMEHARKVFSDYVNGYDMSNRKIGLKYSHSLRVAEICREIAKSLNLSEEEVDLAELIGLLHDIARFEQAKRYDNFDDLKTIDHGILGANLLFNDNLIRDYIVNDVYDDIIRKAVFNHNKASIPEEYSDVEELYTKIVRDADKLDILYLMSINEIKYEKKNEIISREVIECMINKTFVSRQMVKTGLDKILLNLAFVYDLNFMYSYKILLEKGYIPKIIDKLNLEDEETIEVFRLVKEDIYKELNKCEEVA